MWLPTLQEFVGFGLRAFVVVVAGYTLFAAGEASMADLKLVEADAVERCSVTLAARLDSVEARVDPFVAWVEAISETGPAK